MVTILIFLFSIFFIVITCSKFKVHPFLSLILAAFLFGMLSGMPLEQVVENINSGFGGTIGSIGIIIVAGIIIGAFLENSGGAQTLANFVLKIVGVKRVHAAMGIMGWIVSVPVWADSGFIILSPLNRALTKKAGLSIAGTAIALSLGLIISHTLIPPTPGPIAAAGILGADLGRVILVGLGASVFSLSAAIVFAKYIGKKIYVDPNVVSENEIPVQAPESNYKPSVLKSFLPIIVPIILIVTRSFADFPTHPFGEGQLRVFLSFIGNPVTALFIGIFISLFLPKKLDKEMLSTTGWVGSALKSAAAIIIITGAGGAFGKVLQSSDIASLIGDNISNTGLGLWLPFLIAVAIKTAQGSSTVAMITTASIVAPLLGTLGIDSEILRAVTVIVIGAGSSVVSHANDSFFWVVTQMSGINLKQGYRTQTLGCVVIGFSSMIFLTILSMFL